MSTDPQRRIPPRTPSYVFQRVRLWADHASLLRVRLLVELPRLSAEPYLRGVDARVTGDGGGGSRRSTIRLFLERHASEPLTTQAVLGAPTDVHNGPKRIENAAAPHTSRLLTNTKTAAGEEAGMKTRVAKCCIGVILVRPSGSINVILVRLPSGVVGKAFAKRKRFS
jgi:hypothetical protein